MTDIRKCTRIELLVTTLFGSAPTRIELNFGIRVSGQKSQTNFKAYPANGFTPLLCRPQRSATAMPSTIAALKDSLVYTASVTGLTDHNEAQRFIRLRSKENDIELPLITSPASNL